MKEPIYLINLINLIHYCKNQSQRLELYFLISDDGELEIWSWYPKFKNSTC